MALPSGGGANVPGLRELGNIDLLHRSVVKNPDGSISTVRSITVTDDSGRAILIPTVVGRRVVSNQAAINHWRKTGQHLGIFDTLAHADAYSEALHRDQAIQAGVNPDYPAHPLTRSLMGLHPIRLVEHGVQYVRDYDPRRQPDQRIHYNPPAPPPTPGTKHPLVQSMLRERVF